MEVLPEPLITHEGVKGFAACGTLDPAEQQAFDKSNGGALDLEESPTAAEQILPTATIYDAWWTNQQDCDADGCFAGINSDYARLNWDPDVLDCSGSLLVYEKVYYKGCSSSTWTLGLTTTNHTITACSTSDQQGVDVAMGSGCACYDYKIEIYRVGQASPDYTRDPSNDPDLNDHKEELLSQDPCPVRPTIYDAWWTNQQDSDGDGCFAGTNSDYARLNWDPDVGGCSGSLSVFEKVYYKGCSSSTWTLGFTTPNHTITACSTADEQGVDVHMDPGCVCYDYKIEIYRVGQASPDYTRDPSNDPDLNDHKEELLTEDKVCSLPLPPSAPSPRTTR